MAKRKQKEVITVDDQQNFVIDGKFYDAAIIPKTKGEMWRRVSLHNETKVGGAILCGNLEVHIGPCTIEESVLVKEEITIKLGPKSGRSDIQGCVQSGRNIVAEVEDDQDGTYLAVMGDIYSKNVNLSKCLIYGNIYCETAIIRNSVVVGSVYTWKRLELTDSVIGQYLARSVKIGSNTHLLHPVSASENKPDFDEQPGFLLLAESEEEEPVVIPFDENDIVSNKLEFNDPEALLPNHVIGLGMRMLNADEVAARVRESADCIAKILINTTSREEGIEEQRKWEERMLSYTSKEFKAFESATFSLTDVALPKGNLDSSQNLLKFQSPLKSKAEDIDKKTLNESPSGIDVSTIDKSLSEEQTGSAKGDTDDLSGELEHTEPLKDHVSEDHSDNTKRRIDEAKIRFAKGEISEEDLHKIIDEENQ